MTRRTRVVLFALALAVHVAVLYSPAAPPMPHIGGVPTLTHMAVFGAVLYTGVRLPLPALPLVLGLLVHAPVSELVQLWLLPRRAATVYDVAADMFGVGMAYLLLRERR